VQPDRATGDVPAAAVAAPLRPATPHRVSLGDVGRVVGVEMPAGAAGVELTGMAQAAAGVRPGDLYLARPGRRAHGADFAAAARAAGAVAALTDPAGAQRCEAAGMPVVVVEDPATAAGPVAQFVYGHPARAMTMIGITGTNGKTTTSYLVAAGLRSAGRTPGLLGTVVTRIGDREWPATRSTPEATDLAAIFATMREDGCDCCVMEVSSHALALHRVGGVRFDVAAFLNLADDHLDLHGDLASYYAAKASLFTPAMAAAGVVVVDGPWGRRLVTETTVPVTTLSWDRDGDPSSAGPVPVDPTPADVTLTDVGVDDHGSSHGVVRWSDRTAIPVTLRMPGRHNLGNAAVALALLRAVGVDPETAAAGFADVTVPGRVERVDVPGGVLVLVDYAHTPQAIATVLHGARAGTLGRLIAVSGCGGDRDRTKRGPMGAALAGAADAIVVTDDNPRTEDPAAIRASLLAGVRAAGFAGELDEIGDRAAAIGHALARARAGDVVVVLGKGHEQGQEAAGVVHPFDDRDCVRAWALARAGAVP